MSSTLSAAVKKPFTKTNPNKKISLFIAGLGAIGSTLLKQIRELNHPKFQFQLLGVCNSTHTLWNPDLDEVLNDPKLKKGLSTNWNKIPKNLIERNSGTNIFIDATGSRIPAQQYNILLENGIHVVTPIKLANTFGQDYFDSLIAVSSASKTHYLFETTVGPGLPAIKTNRHLIDSGDEITEISGVVSGTMTYLFNQIQQHVPFSEAVQKAKDQGYSEPDPRDDLSGEDVARKFLILARTSGFKFERDQI